MKWRIPEAIPSVPKDTYRIRTWLGLAIHVDPKGNVLSVNPLEKKRHEEVRVEYRIFFVYSWTWIDFLWRLVGSSTSWKWEMYHQECCIQFFPGLGNRQRWHYKGCIERQTFTRLDCQEHSRRFLVGGPVYLLHLFFIFIDRITTSDKPLNKTYDLALSNGDSSQVCSPLRRSKYVNSSSLTVQSTQLYMKPIKVHPYLLSFWYKLRTEWSLLFLRRHRIRSGFWRQWTPVWITPMMDQLRHRLARAKLTFTLKSRTIRNSYFWMARKITKGTTDTWPWPAFPIRVLARCSV